MPLSIPHNDIADGRFGTTEIGAAILLGACVEYRTHPGIAVELRARGAGEVMHADLLEMLRLCERTAFVQSHLKQCSGGETAADQDDAERDGETDVTPETTDDR